jgi:MFS family permease
LTELKGSVSAVLGEWRKGWPVVLSAAIGYGTGGAMFQLMSGLFIVPMRTELGWSMSAVTIAPIVLMAWALISPLAGAAVDRLGSRRSAMLGTLCVAFFTAMLGLLPVSPLILYSLAVLIGFSTALTVVPTYGRGVATWFRSGVGLAFGITLSGSTFVATMVLPLTSTVIQSGGWRMGFLGLAAIMVGVGLPIIFFGFREKPMAASQASVAVKDRTPETGVTFAAAMRDSRFWIYVAAFFVSCIPLGGFGAHLQPLLAYQGFPLPIAISLGVAYVISVTVGRVVGGILLDRIWPFALAAVLLTVAACGAVGIAYASGGGSLLLATAVVCVIGIGQGAEADFIAFFALRSFGLRAFSTIVGVFGMVGTFGVAIGGFGFAALYDRFGDYHLACYIAAGCWVIGGGLLLSAGLRERVLVGSGRLAEATRGS